MKLTCPLGNSRKNQNRWGCGYTFLRTPFETFDFSLYLQEFETKRACWKQSVEILQNCVPPVENFKIKNQDTMKFHISFSLKPQEIFFLFLLNPLFEFFWNSPLLKMCAVKLQQNIVELFDQWAWRLKNQYYKIRPFWIWGVKYRPNACLHISFLSHCQNVIVY